MGGVLKVDAFLNHQDGRRPVQRHGRGVEAPARTARLSTRYFTIEASGIGIARVVAAQHFGVPVVFAKKAKSVNIDGDVWANEDRVVHA